MRVAGHNTVYTCVGPSVRRDSPIPGFSDEVSLCSPALKLTEIPLPLDS